TASTSQSHKFASTSQSHMSSPLSPLPLGEGKGEGCPSVSPAELLVSVLASELEDGAVVATGVASPLAILAIAVARATHAPRLTYLACVGSLDPELPQLLPSSEDLGYLRGR